MFEIKIDGVEELVAKVEKYQAQITALHSKVPQELESWQRDDMRRKFPNQTVETVDKQTTATTYIWPRSRQPSRHRYQRGPKQASPVKRGPVVRSNRPILRAELLDKLWERMKRLTAEAMKWP